MATNYTYDDFDKLLKSTGTNLSQYDLDLARSNPGAGMGIIYAKQNYGKAKTPDAQAYWHKQAENIRTENGYSGGKDGSQYMPTTKDGYLDWGGSQIKETPGSFTYSPYQFSHQDAYDDALNKVVNRQGWSYDATQDQAYQAARKQYLREADRATENTMGNYAAMTGGMPSTAAVNAAQQAGDYHRAQLSDQLGQYIDRDYQRYIDSVGLDFDTLSALRSLDQDQRSRYENDRGFGYGQYTDDLAFRMEQEDKDWDRRSATELGRYTNRTDAERYADEREKEQREWDYQVEQDAYDRKKAEEAEERAYMLDMYDMLQKQATATGDPSYAKRAQAILDRLDSFSGGSGGAILGLKSSGGSSGGSSRGSSSSSADAGGESSTGESQKIDIAKLIRDLTARRLSQFAGNFKAFK